MNQFIPENGIYVYFRFNDEKTLMIIANNNENPKQLDLERFYEMLNEKIIGENIITGDQYSLTTPISLPTRTVFILEIK